MHRAYEKDDTEITRWREETYPQIRNETKKQGAELFRLDEESMRSNDP